MNTDRNDLILDKCNKCNNACLSQWKTLDSCYGERLSNSFFGPSEGFVTWILTHPFTTFPIGLVPGHNHHSPPVPHYLAYLFIEHCHPGPLRSLVLSRWTLLSVYLRIALCLYLACFLFLVGLPSTLVTCALLLGLLLLDCRLHWPAPA